MKVIAKTDKGYILEATEREVANYAGYYYERSHGYRQPRIGCEIVVSPMYSQLEKLKETEKSLISCQSTLRGLADLLEVQAPLIHALANTDSVEATNEP